MNAHSLLEAAAPSVPDDGPDRVARLFDAHHTRLYRLARRLADNADDARDLVQETFLRAASASATLPRGSSREEAWLVRVLINLRRDQWRRADVRLRGASLIKAAGAEGTASPESALIARNAVWQALRQLHPRRRAVIVLHELEDASVTSIAALLGVSAVTVRWHLSRGRRQLENILLSQTGDTR